MGARLYSGLEWIHEALGNGPVKSPEEINRGGAYEKLTLLPERKEANVWAFLSDDERVKMGHILRRSLQYSWSSE